MFEGHQQAYNRLRLCRASGRNGHSHLKTGALHLFAGLKLVVTGATLKNAQSCHAFTLKSLNFNESSLKNFAHVRMCEVFKARIDNVSKSVNQTTFFSMKGY